MTRRASWLSRSEVLGAGQRLPAQLYEWAPEILITNSEIKRIGWLGVSHRGFGRCNSMNRDVMLTKCRDVYNRIYSWMVVVENTATATANLN